jgi:hypothetical protein
VVEKPAPRGLDIELATEGARVMLVQGRDQRVLHGPFPQHLDLEPGTYKVVASLHGREPFVESVTVDGTARKVRIELEPARASVRQPSPSGEAAPPGFDPNADPYE